MSEEHTTAVVQRYLDELDGDSPAEPIVRALLDRSVRRLHLLCATLVAPKLSAADAAAVERAGRRAARRRDGTAAQGAARSPPPDRAPALRAGQPAHAVGAQ